MISKRHDSDKDVDTSNNRIKDSLNIMLRSTYYSLSSITCHPLLGARRVHMASPPSVQAQIGIPRRFKVKKPHARTLQVHGGGPHVMLNIYMKNVKSC